MQKKVVTAIIEKDVQTVLSQNLIRANPVNIEQAGRKCGCETQKLIAEDYSPYMSEII